MFLLSKKIMLMMVAFLMSLTMMSKISYGQDSAAIEAEAAQADSEAAKAEALDARQRMED
ncbi:MAG: hypothetical protein ACK5P5_04975 [Pseudobdellovibrionaceae bacterium]